MVHGLDTTQARLIGILYRFDCPSTLTIGEHVMELLKEPARAALTCHLRKCTLCEAELRAYGAFLADDLSAAA